MFKINDKVKIKKDEKTISYFGEKYAGTKATIKNMMNNNIADVECFDGKTYMSPVEFLETYYEPKKKIPNKICWHENKYKNRISARIVFWVCPDCKKDLGDA